MEKVSAFIKSDVGLVRKNNEDYASFLIPSEENKLEKFGSIFIVADGVGGSDFGEVASSLAVEAIINFYYSLPHENTPQKRLKKSFDISNIELIEKAKELRVREISTTAVCLVILKGNAYIANVGDSRAYLLNKNRELQIMQLTYDHSLVAEQVRLGLLTEEEAKNDPNKNIITRALGAEYNVRVDFFKESLVGGDKILLCSDGLVSVVNNDEIFDVVESNSVENAVLELICLAKRKGGPDNITVCLVGYEKT